MKRSYLLAASSLALIAFGCGLSTYEERLNHSTTTLGHDSLINERLAGELGGLTKLRIRLRPPKYLGRAKEEQVNTKGRVIIQGAPDLAPPFMELPTRLATLRGYIAPTAGGAGRELPLYLYVAGVDLQAGGEAEGEALTPLRDQILAAIPTPPDQSAPATFTAGGQGSRKATRFELLVWSTLGQYPFAVKVQPLEQENLDASLQVFIYTNEQQGTQIALLLFGPSELLTEIAPHDFALCLETVGNVS